MLYRPFGQSGAAVSSLSLVLGDPPARASDRQRAVFAALEAGINSFELRTDDPAAAQALGQALGSIERNLLFVTVRLAHAGAQGRDPRPESISDRLARILAHANLERADVVLFETAEHEPPSPHVLATLASMREGGFTRLVGVAGGDAVEPYLASGRFDVLALPFSIRSGWVERNRLKRAVAHEMPVIGYNFQPFIPPPEVAARAAGPLGIARLFRGPDDGRRERSESPFAFLDHTPNWSAQEICLGYALTEPSLATIQIEARTPEEIEALAAVVERDLPNGVAAQIEMARISDRKGEPSA